MKILIHSNAPWAGTGYGSQTALFAPRFRAAGHDVAISAFWGLYGKAMDWDGITVYPGSAGDYGDKWLPAYMLRHGQGDLSDVLGLTLMDVWVLESKLLAQLNLASWAPVDHEPTPPRVVDFFVRTGSQPIAMSRFGEEMFRKSGLDPLYVPHGIDTNVLQPIPQDEVRHAMGIDPDLFVVGMVAANQGNSPARKAFPQMFEAFAEFHRRHPDSILYLHSVKSNPATGLDLPMLAKVNGIPDDAVMFTPEFELQVGVEYEKMPWVYSNMDVLACPSYGEGFGIPIVEAQACGVPVIVNDFTAMRELAGPAQWVTSGERWYNASQGAWWQSPHVEAIVDRLEDAYQARGDKELSARCREFAVGYDVDAVMEQYWVPALARLEEQLAAKKPDAPMPAVTLGRAERRRRERQERKAAA